MSCVHGSNSAAFWAPRAEKFRVSGCRRSVCGGCLRRRGCCPWREQPRLGKCLACVCVCGGGGHGVLLRSWGKAVDLLVLCLSECFRGLGHLRPPPHRSCPGSTLKLPGGRQTSSLLTWSGFTGVQRDRGRGRPQAGWVCVPDRGSKQFALLVE